MRGLGKNSSSAERHRFGKPVRARATGRTHDLSATAPYTTGAKRVCAVGWTFFFLHVRGRMDLRVSVCARSDGLPV